MGGRHREQSGEKNGEKKGRDERGRKRDGGRQSHSVCLVSGRIIWLAGGKLLYQSPKGRSDFLNRFNKLEECDCPDSAAVSVLIRHSALSELATHGPSGNINVNGLLRHCTGKANLKLRIEICRRFGLIMVSLLSLKAQRVRFSGI